MTRYKVRITDKNGFHKEFPDGSAVGGSYGEPIVVTMELNEHEFKALIYYMSRVSEPRQYVALFKFSQSLAITPWHKRVIREKFRTMSEQVKIEIL